MTRRATPLRKSVLMHGMADKLDADLSSVDADALAERCTHCTKRDDCILWMLEHDHGAAAAPGFCLNAEELGLLRV